jgi:hypothetical protein
MIAMKGLFTRCSRGLSQKDGLNTRIRRRYPIVGATQALTLAGVEAHSRAAEWCSLRRLPVNDLALNGTQPTPNDALRANAITTSRL